MSERAVKRQKGDASENSEGAAAAADCFLFADMDEWQCAALRDIADGHNVFLTGSGGCGKTFLLRRLHDWLKMQPHREAAITSTTGITALLIHGRTVASFFGFGVKDGTPNEMWEHVRKKKYLRDRFKKLTILVVDEISMLAAQTLTCMDFVMRKFRRRNEHPFGGVQMVLCGDFLQLEPVKGDFAFKADVWNMMNLRYHLLRGGHRQSGDTIFAEILAEVRQGNLSALGRNLLKERVAAPLNIPHGMHAAELFSRRIEAQRANDVYLESLDAATEKMFHATLVWVTYGNLSGPQNKIAQQATEKMLLNNMITPEELKLRVGAQVMLTSNLDLKRGLANGSLGIVIDFLAADEDGTSESVAYPMVKFANGVTLLVTPHTWAYEDVTDRFKIEIKQVPLMLARAITVHKSQGATLDFASIKLDNSMFCHGMAYVALSRVRSLDTLTLETFQTGAIQTSVEALDFYKRHNLL